MTRSDCSDSGPGPRLVVLEGMPGAGKSSVAALLADRVPVVAEYARPDGTALDHDAHPATDQDRAHLDNFLLKDELCAQHTGTVLCDRDWVSALAYAHSLNDPVALAHRAGWAWEHLNAGRLRLGGLYLVLHVDPATSTERRRGRLRPDHPWSRAEALERLSAFYAAPAQTVGRTLPGLGELMATTRWVHVDAARPRDEVAQMAQELLTEEVRR
ncbi:AAA family ATPase [Nocardiopsis sp. NPDC006198]|uniref:dTMP kinase n=1 Tax=Nocardiopsis sp. NPDC006198 TaxID=3154472 RepID=UPI0033B71F4A